MNIFETYAGAVIHIKLSSFSELLILLVSVQLHILISKPQSPQ